MVADSYLPRSYDPRYSTKPLYLYLKAAGGLGDAPRTVENWVHHFEKSGFAGLAEGERTDRPSRLSPAQLSRVELALRQGPREAGPAGGGVSHDGYNESAGERL